MDLDKIQVNPALRSGWQAVDLGFLMARAWYRSLLIACALPIFLLAVPLAILLPAHPFWVGFILWWLKPFWERLPLYLASRKLFDEHSAYPEIRARAWRLYSFDCLPNLLWRRLSVQRAFDAPVTVLEELKGKRRRERLRVLHGKYSDVALGNQFVCFCFEVVFCVGLVIAFEFFTPERWNVEIYDRYDELTLVGEWLYAIAGLLAMVLIMPFHAMAGFSLYLNRRIELEAWDIEISFRNLASRKQRELSRAAGAAAAALLAGLLASLSPQDVAAAVSHDRESAARMIDEVLAGPDYGEEKTVRRWRFKGDDEEEDESVPEWILEFLEWLENFADFRDGISHFAWWLKLFLIAGFILLVVYLLRRYRGPLGNLVRRERDAAPPEVLFGLDVTPESLPRDVPAEVRELWRKGQFRDAIGLLYRASLSRLIDRHALEFRASHTEAECAELVRARGIDSLSAFFGDLTQVWRRLAYGHQVPADDVIDRLCNAWSTELADETA